MDIPFSPMANGVAISASTTSANASFNAITGPGEACARFVNGTSVLAHVKLGSSGVTATNVDTAIPPNGVVMIPFNTSQGVTHAAVLLASGTGTVHVQVGRTAL